MYTYFHSRCFDGQEGTGCFANAEFIYAQGDVPIYSEGWSMSWRVRIGLQTVSFHVRVLRDAIVILMYSSFD